MAIKILATDKKLYAFSFRGEVSYIAEEDKGIKDPRVESFCQTKARSKLNAFVDVQGGLFTGPP